MFEREIYIAQSLKHEHIVHVDNHGVTNIEDLRDSIYISPHMSPPDLDYLSRIQDWNDLPFLVYPYIPDGSLSDFIINNPPWQKWSLLQTGELILQAASALHYMHTRSQPLVHWDVKPANFLVQNEGKPTRMAHLYLCDFGISRAQKEKTEETSTVFGTYNYMAPEQFNRKVRCESDQYTLAMMACYLLTSEYPLSANGRTNDLVWADIHQNDVPKRPSFLNSQRVQPGRIDDIIMQALRKAPEERFPTIWTFAKALYDAIRQQESASYAVTLEVETPAVTPSPNFAPMPLHPPIDTSEYQTKVDVQPLIVPQPVVVQNAWDALPFASMKKLFEYDVLDTPQTLCWSRQEDTLGCFFLEQTPLLLYQDGKVGPIADVRTGHVACWAAFEDMLAISSQQKKRSGDESIITITNMHDSSILPLPSLTPAINGLDWSVDGRLALWPEGKKSLLIYMLPQHALTQHAPKPQILSTENMVCGGVGVLRWSPDGVLLAAGGMDGTIMFWQKETNIVYWRNSDFKMPIYNLAWSHNGNFLAVAYKDRKVVIVDVQQKRVKTFWKNLPLVPRRLSFSIDDFLTISSTKDYLLLGNVNEPLPSIKQHGRLLATWSPSGQKLATIDTSNVKKVVVWQR